MIFCSPAAHSEQRLNSELGEFRLVFYWPLSPNTLLGGVAQPMEKALEIPPDLLVGHWRAVQGPLTIDWRFQGDRTFSGKIARRGEVISDFTGNWMLEETWLYSEYTGDSLGMIEAGSNDRDIFLEFDFNHFVVQTSRGKRRYERVQ